MLSLQLERRRRHSIERSAALPTALPREHSDSTEKKRGKGGSRTLPLHVPLLLLPSEACGTHVGTAAVMSDLVSDASRCERTMKRTASIEATTFIRTRLGRLCKLVERGGEAEGACGCASGSTSGGRIATVRGLPHVIAACEASRPSTISRTLDSGGMALP